MIARALFGSAVFGRGFFIFAFLFCLSTMSAQAVPVACFVASPNPLTVGGDLILDSGCSFETSSGATFLADRLYDLNNDGNIDTGSGPGPLLVDWAWLASLGWGGGAHTIKLTVTDFNPDTFERFFSTTTRVVNVVAATTPVPSALPLFASGLAGLTWLARRRRKQQTHLRSPAIKPGVARAMFIVTACLASCVLMHEGSFAATYDLQTQWSDANNPNGAWAYRQGTTALPSIPDWRGWGSAWAAGTNAGSYLPAFFKYDGGGPFSALAGDILMHSVDAANGNPSLGEGNVIFTSLGAGIATISGKVWDAQQTGRTQDWQVLVNNAVVASGIFDGLNDRNNPATFSFVIALALNDVVELTTFRHLFGTGNLNGIDLTIDVAAAVPIPATLPMFVSGLAGLGWLARRQKKQAGRISEANALIFCPNVSLSGFRWAYWADIEKQAQG